MILYPAIDIKDGNCVRLLRGNMNKETVFNNKPESQADTFEKLGCEWLHLVDLNGALDGLPINYQTVRKILQRLNGMEIMYYYLVLKVMVLIIILRNIPIFL